MNRIALVLFAMVCTAVSINAQRAAEQRGGLAEPVVALDAKSAPALEARLMTQVLNGSDDSPVMNSKISVKNITPNFYVYVSGWVTFYDASGMRCGDGMFKVDALAPQEAAEVDTPGLRLRCTPASWRVVANNLLTRTVDIAKPAEVAPAVESPIFERPAPTNFIISIDGEEHPIQVNNPVVLKLANKNRTIILKSAP